MEQGFHSSLFWVNKFALNQSGVIANQIKLILITLAHTTILLHKGVLGSKRVASRIV